jgi:RNA polymerase primary sigma factor
VTPQKDKVSDKEGGSESSPDSPLLDLSDAAVKKLIRTAKRGYFTHEQINSLSKEVNSEPSTSSIWR